MLKILPGQGNLERQVARGRPLVHVRISMPAKQRDILISRNPLPSVFNK